VVLSYSHPAGVENPPGTAFLVTGNGGAVAIDEPLLRLWTVAAGRTLDAIRDLPEVADLRDILPEALGCLAEARLLQRLPADSEPAAAAAGASSPVSAIVVVSSAAELTWLAECLRSLEAQHAPPAEIVLVDNGGVTPGTWPSGSVPVHLHVRKRRGPYAAALNDGVAAARESFLLLLNADVKLDSAAIERMLARAAGDPTIAAVAPKLKFWRTPGFLNGIGNRVIESDWGSDNAIGQLDLGQFDHWTDVPSGCLTALLVSADAFRAVGPFDAAYPAYYEDTDWAYRARSLGYRVAAAPAAEVLHVFGASWNAPGSDALTPAKQARAGAGRLRFLWKIPSGGLQRRLVARCLWQDFNGARAAEHARNRPLAWAQIHGILRFAAGLPSAVALRREIQRRRRVADADLFVPEESMPRSALAGANPLLTSALIREYYAPLMRAGRTRPLPELAWRSHQREMARKQPSR
jgi:GT2 family glycosyltransferase